MSLHKLTAGSGYDYLTRQVAALDATERGHTTLASYYTERGEVPGVWLGTGLASLPGLSVGDAVTEEQMRALFGKGMHPLAEQISASLTGPDTTEQDVQRAVRLGAPYRVFTGDATDFRKRVAAEVASVNERDGLPSDWPVEAQQRATIRTDVARQMFTQEHGRAPMDERELTGFIARNSRPRTQAVAGFDLTFSPVKSVSALWALADPATAARIEQAHRAAVTDALTFVEQHALFTRVGAGGVRQVLVTGLIGAAFTHRDSRAGDPDLHTHVAVANKVATLDGRWLAIDGRVLYAAHVTASETYNTALEHHLTAALRITFAERPDTQLGKRPVREIVGLDPQLLSRWSVRRAAITTRQGELAAAFQADHGRPPTPVEAIKLAQQANLETRDAKHEARTLPEQRTAWRAEAENVLGGADAVRRMLTAVLTPTTVAPRDADEAWVAAAAQRVIGQVQARRATWQIWHVRAEAQRQVRAANLQPADPAGLVDALTTRALTAASTRLGPPDDGVTEPAPLRRADGTSMYAVCGADLYTSPSVLAAEQRLVESAARSDGACLRDTDIDAALASSAAAGVVLNVGQAALVRALATSRRRVQVAIAPAGAGKTTAMATLTSAWTAAGGTVLGLAPSAAAAHALADATGTTCDTLDKLTYHLREGRLPDWAKAIGRSTLVIVDEAGMADTLTLDTAISYILGQGGSVRLIGDDQQLAAVGAGGVLRDIATTHGAHRLTELLRFDDPAEAAATLALRDGRPDALGFYLDNGRVHVGDPATTLDQAFTAWAADRQQGRDVLMLAPTRDLVASLNARARTHRLDTDPNARRNEPAVPLADGNAASAGDVVLTRANDRRLRTAPTDWVKNGDRWTVTTAHPTGALTVRHTRTRRSVTLPAAYVTTHVELG